MLLCSAVEQLIIFFTKLNRTSNVEKKLNLKIFKLKNDGWNKMLKISMVNINMNNIKQNMNTQLRVQRNIRKPRR